MTREAINELKKYTLGKKNTEKVEISVLQLNRVIKALEQEIRWIPVSERLPEEYRYVFASTDAEEVFIAEYLGKMNDGTDCFDDEDGMMWDGDVIAWMPLPKPYKAESEK